MSARGIARALTCAFLALVCASPMACQEQRGDIEVVYTVGDLISIHDEVRVGGRSVQGQTRLSVGETITTGPTGRARIVLDSGATVAVSESTKLTLEEGKLVVEAGRAFVRAEKVPLQVVWQSAQAKVAQSAVALDLTREKGTSVYCAQGEILVTAGGKQHRVQGGETASFMGDRVRVLPEKAFEDWTGGLAEPSDAVIEGKSAIPQIRARESNIVLGHALIVRSHQVDTKIVGEVAVTRSKTTYFNGSDSGGKAHVRLWLPPEAMLTKVALTEGSEGAEQLATLQIAAGPSRMTRVERYGLEWAGAGWLQGTIAYAAAGETLTLSLEYAEWLPVVGGKATYRYPTETDSSLLAVGDLALRVDAQETGASFLSVSTGAQVQRRAITYRAADVHPSGDFVVEYEPGTFEAGSARTYVERTGAQKKDAYILVRTELPEAKLEGITLVVVLDTSLSAAATLETSRAVVEAVLEGLGPNDSLLILAANEKARPVESDKPSPVTPDLKKALKQKLARLRPGGASNLAAALQSAADFLDDEARGDSKGEGMLLYVGDGRPTVGEPDAQAIRTLLSARPFGMPRLGAVAVGPSADRWLLSNLVSAQGTVLLAQERQDAARVGAALLAEALTPRHREVTLDLGPHVDRLYPRGPQVITAGSTVEVIGRLRGPMPGKIGLSYRRGGKLVEESRSTERLSVPPSGALSKKWAAARVKQIASDGAGIEPAIALAHEYQLTTPWTSWLFDGAPEVVATGPFSARILDLSTAHDAPYAGHVDPVLRLGSSLIEPETSFGEEGTLVDAAEAAMRRLIFQAARSVRACRDARAAVNPEVGASFHLAVTIDGAGVATRVVVRSNTSARPDRALFRCIEGVVKALPFVGIGQSVSVAHDLTLEGGRSLRPTKCSEASRVALPVRREIWRATAPSTVAEYRATAEQCELMKWRDRQAYLLLMMENVSNNVERLALSEQLFLSGEGDAADFVRDHTLRSVESFEELQSLLLVLRKGEPDVTQELKSALAKAKSEEEGLEICQKFLRLAPHSSYARRRLLSYLESLERTEALVGAISGWRFEAVTDSGLLAEGASALMRLGRAEEASSAFSELIERAPRDPWTLAFVGDRLRAEGLYDEAGAAYDSLARMMPEDAGVTLRQALAHAGAGRIDVASRLLGRVTQTGGRYDDGRLAELAAIVEATLLAGARGGKVPEVEAELQRRLLRIPLPDAKALVLVSAAPHAEPVRLELMREDGETLAQAAEMDARDLGLSAARVERGQQGAVRLALRRDEVAGPSHPVEAIVSLLWLGPPGTLPEMQTKTVQVPADGKALELRVAEGRLL